MYFKLLSEGICYTTPYLHSHPQAAVVSTVASLAARNAREQWENIFNQNYIQPVLQVYIAYV